MRERSEMQDNVITAIPNMMFPTYMRKNTRPIHYSRKDKILGYLLAFGFITFLFWFGMNYINFGQIGGLTDLGCLLI